MQFIFIQLVEQFLCLCNAESNVDTYSTTISIQSNNAINETRVYDMKNCPECFPLTPSYVQLFMFCINNELQVRRGYRFCHFLSELAVINEH